MRNLLWEKRMKIKISNLTKRYEDVRAVDGVSFQIEDNQIFALLGVNGAGKTTTIKMMTGLLSPDSGEIFYGDISLQSDLAKIKGFINVSPQETAVAENLTVRENLAFIAGIYGFDKQKAVQKTEEILAKFQLDKVKNKRAKTLSGGTQRRLSIAMALVSEPKVLFLDEPTLGLDVLARAELWKLIRALKSQMTILLTTHYMEEAEQLADVVAIMKEGKILRLDTPENLMRTAGENTLERAFIKIVQGGNV